MGELASYVKTGAIAKIIMDDGKVNVMSRAMLNALLSAFDHAEKDAAIVLLTSGRDGIFSAGFDTKVLGSRDPRFPWARSCSWRRTFASARTVPSKSA